MQKYLRRREFDKMLWCVAEIYLHLNVMQMTKRSRQQKV